MENQENSDLTDFGKQVSMKEARKLKAINGNKQSVWKGLGVFGMIGWSIVVPGILGAILGKWLDEKYHQAFSWTLTLLLSGLVMGCIVAWTWIDKEDKKMNQ
jgi:ATP synthase protein I